MLMLYISCMMVGLVLTVFNMAANIGLHAARGVKPFQTNIIVDLVALFILNMISIAVTLYAPGEISEYAFAGSAVVAIIPIWFFRENLPQALSRVFLEEERRKVIMKNSRQQARKILIVVPARVVCSFVFWVKHK